MNSPTTTMEKTTERSQSGGCFCLLDTGINIKILNEALSEFYLENHLDKEERTSFLKQETEFCNHILDRVSDKGISIVYFNTDIIGKSVKIDQKILERYRTIRGGVFALLDGFLSKSDKNKQINQEEITIIRPGFLSLVGKLEGGNIKVGLISSDKSKLELWLNSKGYGNQKSIPELSDIINHYIGGASLDPRGPLFSDPGVNECKLVEARFNKIQNKRGAVLVDYKETPFTLYELDKPINDGRLLLLPKSLIFSNPYTQKR